eukprot:TRINITY_DN11250_c0_g1_i1.p1 TRINITY_DN11250_c0_g1~~TRINITY_DN11250_c0_g1_i1.p1  ORF type:complete len:703 (+),score=210.14 TRINITY_DN11250_c0_g1_i1:24-2132(+)
MRYCIYYLIVISLCIISIESSDLFKSNKYSNSLKRSFQQTSCSFGSWGNWSDCRASCGGPTKVRTRECMCGDVVSDASKCTGSHVSRIYCQSTCVRVESYWKSYNIDATDSRFNVSWPVKETTQFTCKSGDNQFSGKTWIELLDISPMNDQPWLILAREFIVARLNYKTLPTSPEITALFDQVTNLLGNCDFTTDQGSDAIGFANELYNLNNGRGDYGYTLCAETDTPCCLKDLVERQCICPGFESIEYNYTNCPLGPPEDTSTPTDAPSNDTPTTSTPTSSSASNMTCSWTYGNWSNCTVNCGGGYKTRDVHCTCLNKTNKVVYDETDPKALDSCIPSSKPPSNTTCSTSKCCDWSEWSEWSTCTTSCNGVSTRSRRCHCNNDTTVDASPTKCLITSSDVGNGTLLTQLCDDCKIRPVSYWRENNKESTPSRPWPKDINIQIQEDPESLVFTCHSSISWLEVINTTTTTSTADDLWLSLAQQFVASSLNQFSGIEIDPLTDYALNEAALLLDECGNFTTDQTTKANQLVEKLKNFNEKDESSVPTDSPTTTTSTTTTPTTPSTDVPTSETTTTGIPETAPPTEAPTDASKTNNFWGPNINSDSDLADTEKASFYQSVQNLSTSIYIAVPIAVIFLLLAAILITVLVMRKIYADRVFEVPTMSTHLDPQNIALEDEAEEMGDDDGDKSEVLELDSAMLYDHN